MEFNNTASPKKLGASFKLPPIDQSFKLPPLGNVKSQNFNNKKMEMTNVNINNDVTSD